MIKFRSLFVAPVLATFAFAGSAQAHTKLISSSPAANSTVAKPGKVVLNFNERVVAAFVKTELMMTGMPGMADHPPMKMAGYTTAMSKDGKIVTLLMKKALPAGSYMLKWSAAGADTHRMEGSFLFIVR